MLENIKSPNDIKELSMEQLHALIDEIRAFLVQCISRTGGHLASNLGVTELTVALHYCYDMPADKIVWDVGHQCYAHKLLTGRMDKFDTLRQFGGLSGFPKTSESVYDCFDTGHSTTSISAAFGLATARDIMGKKNKVIAVIGDGAMTGGMAYEALNNAGRAKTDLIVVLNDNQMSISENVGAISKHLNDIRTAPYYLSAKRDVNDFLRSVPVVGKGARNFIEIAKNKLRYFLLPGVLFEELGFKYIGPVDGNNFDELLKIFTQIKNLKGPVLVHVLTKKGKGYFQAENMPSAFHGVDSFDIKTGTFPNKAGNRTFTDVFGDSLVELAKKNKRVAAITASMPAGTGLTQFADMFPKRFFDVGIAEQHAVTFAAGLAREGLIPVFAVYSTFLQRSYDQILHDVCMQNLPVIFAVDRAGIVGADGETHQGIFDLSYLGHMPNMTVLAPRDGRELAQMLEFAVNLRAPAAIRYPRETVPDAGYETAAPLELGKPEILRKGEKIALIGVGAMCSVAAGVCNRLVQMGENPAFINARFVKPFNFDLSSFKYIFTIEDNVASGGFGAALSLTYGKAVNIFAFPDKFIEQGTREQLFEKYGLDAESIFNEVLRIINE